MVQTLSSSVGLEETLEILGRKLEAILPGTAALFLLGDEADVRQTAEWRAAAVGLNREYFCRREDAGSSSTSLQGRPQPGDLSGRVRCRRPDADFVAVRAVGPRCKPALIVPIVHQGEVLGTINLYHPDAEAFGAHDKQLLETIAERAATALYNGLLFDRTRSHAFTDPLTGLYNLRHITQHVEERCRERRAVRPAVPGPGQLQADQRQFRASKGRRGAARPAAPCSWKTSGTATSPPATAATSFWSFVQGGTPPKTPKRWPRACSRPSSAYEPGLICTRAWARCIWASPSATAASPPTARTSPSLIAAADTHMYREKTERKLGSLAGEGRSQPSHDAHSSPLQTLGPNSTCPAPHKEQRMPSLV